MARCGCRGERSCLVCEEEARGPTVLPDYQFYQCVNCGRLLQSMPADFPDGPLVTCPAPCGHAHVLTVPDHVTLGTTSLEFGTISVVKEFVFADEETALVKHMDSLSWAQSQSGRRKQVYTQTHAHTILCVLTCMCTCAGLWSQGEL